MIFEGILGLLLGWRVIVLHDSNLKMQKVKIQKSILSAFSRNESSRRRVVQEIFVDRGKNIVHLKIELLFVLTVCFNKKGLQPRFAHSVSVA